MISSWFRRLFSREHARGSPPADDLQEFQARLAYRFKDPDLLAQALTHRSFVFQEGQERKASNERLEFLGDAVLAICLNEALVQDFPDYDDENAAKSRRGSKRSAEHC